MAVRSKEELSQAVAVTDADLTSCPWVSTPLNSAAVASGRTPVGAR